MPLPPKPASKNPIPPGLDPSKNTPSQLVQHLISRGRLPHAVVDYPRFDEAGVPVVQVHIRLLTLKEQDLALANARAYVNRLTRVQAEGEARAEELEHNARIAEILAIACREPDDPSKPFFAYGVVDTREHCTAEELGILANVYATLASERLYLNQMNETEMNAILKAVAEGALSYPFSFCSREQLEILLGFAARSLDAMGAFSTGQNPTSSSTSDLSRLSTRRPRTRSERPWHLKSGSTSPSAASTK